MIKRLFSAFLGLATGAASAPPDPWPDLPHSGFIAGRTAEEADVDQRDAVSVSRFGGELTGKPVALPIPQFAYLIDDRGVRTPVVVVQAEANERGTFLGMRDAAGKEYVATEPEVELLGARHP